MSECMSVSPMIGGKTSHYVASICTRPIGCSCWSYSAGQAGVSSSSCWRANWLELRLQQTNWSWCCHDCLYLLRNMFTALGQMCIQRTDSPELPKLNAVLRESLSTMFNIDLTEGSGKQACNHKVYNVYDVNDNNDIVIAIIRSQVA